MPASSIKLNLPWWAKTVIAAEFLAIVSYYCLGVAAIVACKEIGLKWLDPKEMPRVAHEIGELPEPLPDGYHYVVSMSVPAVGLYMVTMEHLPDKQLIALRSNPTLDVDTTKEELDKAVADGLATLNYGAKMTKVEERATAQIGSQKMDYVIGETLDFTGRIGKGMLGCIQVPGKNGRKNILIY
ncbi:MAG: hypothetical protein ACRD3W_09735, partial [Terriglobales bacterium]